MAVGNCQKCGRNSANLARKVLDPRPDSYRVLWVCRRCSGRVEHEAKRLGSGEGTLSANEQDRLKRALLFYRDGGRCGYCGREMRFNEMTIDHIYPLSRGGTNTPENLAACCASCNNRKGNALPEEIGMFVRESGNDG